MTIPAAPQETGENKRLLFLCESDGAGGLRPVLFCSAANDGNLTEGERLQALAVGGRRADGEPATDGPVGIGVVYKSSPSANANGDIVALLGDDRGRARVAGATSENSTPTGDLVMVGGRYDATDRNLSDGRGAAPALDGAARMIMAPIIANAIVNPLGITVAAKSEQVLAARTSRVTAVFINDSDEVIYMALGTTAEMNKGIRLNPNGGSYEINLTNMYEGAIYAICASGGKNLCIQETYRT